ncbi:MAG: DoxX family protein [Acidobacteria bacterium]|nr:DoxX family protein [Acidobacteriota bacterium]
MKNKQMEWGLAILRVIVGIVFLVHGGQKLFVYGFGGVAGFLGTLGIPAPMLSAVVVTSVEFLGGLALVLGLFTRWAALALAVNMLVAILTAHLQAGFFTPKGYEYALSLLGASVALALTGPGAVAVDGRRKGGQA